ncbi:hypothetical protein A9Q87_08590 [Flavobacteriales bacterium 34_180_T64]|nr:hypothetical protein A9Q87_08590 [Flavobacteriales bacterium 34_180_T64]
MENLNWTKEELVAYVLLFAANSDFTEDKDEKELILSKVDKSTYKSINKEFQQDNDFQSIQKILAGLKQHNYSKGDLDILFADIKALFLADGNYDTIERHMFADLKRLLS